MPAATLTIAICTHDRAEDVGHCLALLHPQIGAASADVLVIDSGSSPDEAQRLAALAASFDGVRLLRLDEPGLSRARNAAVAAAAGEWIAFLDDDALPDPDWLQHALRLAAMAPERCGIIGGNVEAVFPQGLDPDLGRRWRQLLSLVTQPDESFDARDAAVCGANVLYRRRCVTECGGFPLTLGRVGGSLLSGEEKLLGEIATAGGWTTGRSKHLRAGHRIPAARTERRWVVRRAYWDGVSDQRIRALLGEKPRQTEIPRLLARAMVLGALYPIPSRQHEFFLRFWYTLGRLRELLARAPSADHAAGAQPDIPGRLGRA